MLLFSGVPFEFWPVSRLAVARSAACVQIASRMHVMSHRNVGWLKVLAQNLGPPRRIKQISCQRNYHRMSHLLYRSAACPDGTA